MTIEFVDDLCLMLRPRVPRTESDAFCPWTKRCREPSPVSVWKSTSNPECFIKYRGKGAASFLETHKQPGGSLKIDLGCDGLKMNVVRRYKYFGGFNEKDGATRAEARYKGRQGMSANVLLAVTLSGCSQFSPAQRACF